MDEIKALDRALVKMARETRAAVNEVDVDGGAKKALVNGVAHSEDLQSRVQKLLRYPGIYSVLAITEILLLKSCSTIVELREDIKDLKGGPGFFGACKGFIYSSWNKATLSDMKDKLASAIRVFKV
jgi:hypothetical protein